MADYNGRETTFTLTEANREAMAARIPNVSAAAVTGNAHKIRAVTPDGLEHWTSTSGVTISPPSGKAASEVTITSTIVSVVQSSPDTIPAPDVLLAGRLRFFIDDTCFVVTGGAVSQVVDKTIFARTLLQSDATKRLLYQSNWRNGRGALKGDGTARYLSGELGATFYQPLSFWVAGRCPNVGARQNLFDGTKFTATRATAFVNAAQPDRVSLYAGASAAIASPSSSPAFHSGVGGVLAVTFDPVNGSLVEHNGTSYGTGLATGSNWITGLTIGAAYDFSSWFNGEIAMLAMASGTVTAQERQTVTAWMRAALNL